MDYTLKTRVLQSQRETIGDDGVPGDNANAESLEWPYNCKYFVAELMEAVGALTLLACDAKFHMPDSNSLELLTALDMTDTGICSYSLFPSEPQFDDKLRMSDLKHGDTRVIFISQKRHYPKNSTVNTYELKLSTWLRILSSGEIIPDAVDILHENNGGWGVHTSYCSHVKGMSCQTESPHRPTGREICAYHVCLKPRPWWNEEHFVYARYDFHSGKQLILVAGTSLQTQLQCLSSRFNSMTRPHLFSIFLALATTWIKDLERFVWDQDFATQQLESDTGWSTVGHTQVRPLPPEKLALRKGMITTKDALSHVVRASESLGELFVYLSKQSHSLPLVGPGLSLHPDQLNDAFLQYSTRQWHLKRQANALIDRIDSQWNVVNALIAQHNNSLNCQIANDSRIDTIIIRRISFVTIAFLPATFLATFFSMSFFDIRSGSLTVSPTIWIYAVCAIPVTLIIAWQASTMGLSQVQWIVSQVSEGWSNVRKRKERASRGNNLHTVQEDQAQMSQMVRQMA